MLSNTLSVLLHFSMLSLAMAAPVTTKNHGYHFHWQHGVGGGVVGFAILILDIIVILEVLQSTRPISHKLLWCLGVFFFPLIGVIVYWLFSNRYAHMRGGGYEIIP